MSENELLTTGQIAAETGVHRSTVDYWATSGKLPYTTTSTGIRLFRRSAVEALIAERNEAAS